MTHAETLYDRSFESLVDVPTDELMSLIEVKTEQAISLEGIAGRLREGRSLNVKFGTDPTGPDLHLGHIVPIRVLDLFNRAGHHVDLIFGDFTAKVGDPTERENGRPLLTDETIADNMATFQEQVDQYFDTRRENVSIHTNSTWLGRMSLAETFSYLQAINLTEASQRKDFRERMAKGQAVSLAETIYGTLMGIDSVHLDTDIEIGGVDQLLNFQQTRTVQRAKGKQAEEILMTPIIEGTSGDGRKMSKSFGNYIPVRTSSDDIFGKIMSIPDKLVVPYFKAFAPIYKEEVAGLEESLGANPFELKKQLATYIAAVSSGSLTDGVQARDNFERRFSERKIDIDDAIKLPTAESLRASLLASGDFPSSKQLSRLAEQGGIRVGNRKISVEELQAPAPLGSLISVGKRKVYLLSDSE